MNETTSTIEIWPLDAVKPYERSLKVRSHVKIRAIADSIQAYGFDQPIVVDDEGVVIKGIGRLEAAKYLGMKEVPVTQNLGMTAIDIMAARIADNRVAESEWDKDFLWEEVEDLIHEGMEPRAFGFDPKRLQDMFPEMTLDNFSHDPEKEQGKTRQQNNPLSGDGLPEFDEESPGGSGVIMEYRGEDDWYNRLSMVDFLNLHDTLVLDFSGGKTSVATLLWCIDNGLKDKLFVIYGNVGWGIESPDMYRYIKYIEDKVGIIIHCAGSSNPRHPGGFDDNIMQFGFPETYRGCWVETELRNSRINALLKNEEYQRQSSNTPLPGKILSRVITLSGVRWENGPLVRAAFPERGHILNSNMAFASPLVRWKTKDVIKYLDSKSCKLPEMYLTQNTHNCFLCPKNSKATNYYIRKRYPKLWTRVLHYYSEGSRFTETLSESIYNWLTTGEDIDDFPGDFSSMVSVRLDQYLKRDLMDKEYRNSAHRIVEDELQGQPIYRSVADQFNITVCGG